MWIKNIERLGGPLDFLQSDSLPFTVGLSRPADRRQLRELLFRRRRPGSPQLPPPLTRIPRRRAAAPPRLRSRPDPVLLENGRRRATPRARPGMRVRGPARSSVLLPQPLLLMLVIVMVMTPLPIGFSRAGWLGAMAGGSSPDGPPEPASLFLGPVPLALLEGCPQPGPPLVFLFPILRPVEFPVLAEIGGEGFREEEQLDVITPGGQILVAKGVLLTVIVPLAFALPIAQPGRRRRRRRREEGRIREQHAQPAGQLLPPPPRDDDDLRIHDSQSPVRHPDPPSRPPHSALPLPGAPDQHRGDDAAHQCDFFSRLDDPVDGAAHAGTVLAGPQEEEVGEEAQPEGEDEEEEGVLAAAVAEVEILGPERGFEDEEVEVDLRGRGGEAGERVRG